MPRRDKTFSDVDLLRIFLNNLEPQEQINLVAFFQYFAPSSTSKDQTYINLFGAIIGLIPIVGDAINIAFEAKEVADEILLDANIAQRTRDLARRSGLSFEQIWSIWVRELPPVPPPKPGPPPSEGLE